MGGHGWLPMWDSPSAPSVRHWDRLCPSAVKGEGYWWVCLVVAPRHTLPLWIADQVRNDVTVLIVLACSLTSRAAPLDCGSSPQ